MNTDVKKLIDEILNLPSYKARFQHLDDDASAISMFLNEGTAYKWPEFKELLTEGKVDAEDLSYLFSKLSNNNDFKSLTNNYTLMKYSLHSVENGLNILIDVFHSHNKLSELFQTKLLREFVADIDRFDKKDDQKVQNRKQTLKNALVKLHELGKLKLLTSSQLDYFTKCCLTNMLMDKEVFSEFYRLLSARRQHHAIYIEVFKHSDLVRMLYELNWTDEDRKRLKEFCDLSTELEELDKDESQLRLEFDERLRELREKRCQLAQLSDERQKSLENIVALGIGQQYTVESLINILTKDDRKKKCKLNL